MPKFSFLSYESNHRKNLSARAKRVEKLFRDAIARISRTASLAERKDGEDFDWEDYPALRREMDALTDDLRRGLQLNIEEACREAWLLSAVKNSALVAMLTAGHVVPREVLDTWNMRNLGALQSFIERRTNGISLSDRVWKVGKQFREELEMALETGIGKGRSAADLSRDVRQYLRYPDKLFRRVRDEQGNLRLSKAAAAFHPGQGVYRSSYKNALRMTGTETNMAYHTADHERWQQLPFVLGIDIAISNNHPVPDICDDLAGRYPKDFLFTGWHPNCRCYAVSVLASQEEMDAYTAAILRGEDVSGWQFSGEVTEPPKQWGEWIEKNRERMERAKSLPYFIRDNAKYVEGVGNTHDTPTAASVSKGSEVAVSHKELSKQTLEWGRQNVIGKKTYSNPAFNGKVARFTKNSFTENLRYGELFGVKTEILTHLDDYLLPDLNFRFENPVHGTSRGFYKAQIPYRGVIEGFKGRLVELQFSLKEDGNLYFYFIKIL